MKKVLPLAVLVLLAFLLIVSFTGIVGSTFGQIYEQILLVFIAVSLVIFLIWDKKYGPDSKSDKGEEQDDNDKDAE